MGPIVIGTSELFFQSGVLDSFSFLLLMRYGPKIVPWIKKNLLIPIKK